jgi:UDP-N-acetylglucosamine--N-acetylmuramyl-(pentapeptide) pyrophosphoryl-undecaprenol N-acetylglucosamine transferase
MTSLDQGVVQAAGTPLVGNELLLRGLEHRCIADRAAYAVERYLPSAEQRAAYVARAAALLDAAAWEQRNLGVKLLGVLQAREHCDALVHLIEDRTPASWLARCFGGDFRQVGFIRRNGLAALARIGAVDDGIERALVTALSDPYYEARAEAARTIAGLGERLTTRRDDLMSALQRCTHDRWIEVAATAAEALGAVGDRQTALPALLQLAEARFWKVRMAALQGIRLLVERGQFDDLEALERAVRGFVLASTDFKPEFHIKRTYGNLLTAIAAQKDSAR